MGFTSIDVMYAYAMLADAAYVAFSESHIDPSTGRIDSSARELFTNTSDDEPKGRGWTEQQFIWFQQNFIVYKNANGDLAYQDNTSSGFAATMFEYVGSDIQGLESGNVFFAGRGTEETLADFNYDSILAFGQELDPSIRKQSQIPDLDAFIKEHFLDSEGNLSQNLISNIHYTGHSLGGHLAMIASAGGSEALGNSEYASTIQSALGGIQIFNSAGLFPLSKLWTDLISDLVESGFYNNSNSLSLVAEEDWDVTANEFTFERTSNNEFIFIEENGGLIDSHYISFMVETLSVMRIIAALAPNANDHTDDKVWLSELFRYSENESLNTLEHVLQQVAKLVGIQYQDDWQAMYEEITETNPALKDSFTLIDMTGKSIDQLVQEARTDPRVAYALEHNLPFVLDNDAGLPIYGDPQYDYSQQSDAYIRDRATFHTAIMDRNYNDTSFTGQVGLNEPTFIWDRENNEYVYTDLHPLKVEDGLVNATDLSNVIFGSNSGDETFNGFGFNDRLYGRGGNDTIHGGDGNDYIEGGTDDDHLYGEGGFDTLVGGAGFDTYYVDSTSDRDTIIDSDGQGSIDFGGVVLTGGKRLNSESAAYINEDEGIRYLLLNGDLHIQSVDGGSIHTIKNFQNGDLGITLDGAIIDAPQIAEPSNLILNQSHEQPYSDGTTYYRYSPTADAEGDASINQTISGELDLRMSVIGSNGDTTIHGSSLGDSLAGDNWFYDPVYGSAQNFGDDVLYGYGGDDSLEGFWGNDWLEGGDGNDYLLDDIGYNQIFIESQTLDEWNQILPGNSDDVLIGGSGDDQLEASRGNDRLDGGIGNDTLYAGAGDDIALGGAGDDVIFTDAYWAYSWTESSRTKYNLDATDGIGGNDFVDAGAGADLVFAGTGDDHVYGGDGDDKLYGDGDLASDASGWTALNQGDDTIYGGAGADRIYGMGGNDNLHGGDGDDEIHGDRLVDMNGVALDESLHGNDNITGGLGNDTIFSHGGDDVISGDEGDDIILTDKGNDIAYGGADNDQIQLGEGNDIGYGGTGVDILAGEAGDDLLFGEEGNDQLQGGDGNDSLDAGSGDDSLYGEAGSDLLLGGDGNDWLYGGTGNDIIAGGAGMDAIYAGSGNDIVQINLGDGPDIIRAAEGNNVIQFGAGISFEDLFIVYASNPDGTLSNVPVLAYGSGNDFIQFEENSLNDFSRIRFADGSEVNMSDVVAKDESFAGPPDVENPTIQINNSISLSDISLHYINSNLVITYSGSEENWLVSYDQDSWTEELTGAELNARFEGLAFDENSKVLLLSNYSQANLFNYIRFIDNGSENVSLINNSSIETINVGTGVGDTFVGVAGADEIYLGDGDDTADTGAGDDLIDAGSGNDFIQSGDDNDTIYAGLGNDVVEAGSGNDVIIGGSGDDLIESGVGDDLVQGGSGNDIIMDESGNDTYHFNLGDGTDYIEDLEGVDRLILGEGITLSDLIFEDVNGALTISISGTNDKLILSGWNQIDQRIETIELTDGTSLSPLEMNDLKINNRSPFQLQDLYDQAMVEGELFNYVIPESTFIDLDLDNLSYDLRQADGSPLPEWLTFDPNTRTLTGVPDAASSSLELSIVVTDENGLSISDTLSIDKYNVIDMNVSGNSIQVNEAQNYLIYGTSVNDRVQSIERTGNDYSNIKKHFYLGEGDDFLDIDQRYSTNFIHLGPGDDKLITSYLSKEVIFYNLGDGNDYLKVGNEDVIVFGEGINPDDWELSMVDNQGYSLPIYDDLLLTHKNGIDSIIIPSWFYSESSGGQVGQFQFEDGTVWTSQQITDIFWEQNGTADNDTFIMPAGGGTLDSGAGNDDVYVHGVPGTNTEHTIKTGSGDDSIEAHSTVVNIDSGIGNDTVFLGYRAFGTVVAGAGDDSLVIDSDYNYSDIYGGTGNDTYLVNGNGSKNFHFAKGDGNDQFYFSSDYEFSNQANKTQLIFSSDIDPDSVNFIKDGNDLLISFSDSTDSLLVESWFELYTHQFQSIIFENDSSIISNVDINAKFYNINGSELNDYLSVPSIGGIVNGYAGDDYISLSAVSYENTTYEIYGGDGNDILGQHQESISSEFSYYIDGGDGNDLIYASIGREGESTIRMGKGDDTLMISPTSFYTDTIRHNQLLLSVGDGNDRIVCHDGGETGGISLVFGEGVSQDDIKISRQGNDLLIKYSDTDSVKMVDFFKYAQEYITDANTYFDSYLVFNDGTSLSFINLITQDFMSISGTDGNDIIEQSQWSWEDVITPGAGNDTVILSNSDSVINFAPGDGQDVIENDIYGSNRTISLAQGISESDLVFRRVNDTDLEIEVSENDSILCKDWFVNLHRTFEILLDSGPILDSKYIISQLSELNLLVNIDDIFQFSDNSEEGNTIFSRGYVDGGLGNDTIYSVIGSSSTNLKGGDGDDTLYGFINKGNFGDRLISLLGGNGSDHLINGHNLNGQQGDDILEVDVSLLEEKLGSYNTSTFTFHKNSLGFGHDTIILNSDNPELTSERTVIELDGFRSQVDPNLALTLGELDLTRNGYDLLITISSDSSITIKDWYKNNSNKVYQLIIEPNLIDQEGDIANVYTYEQVESYVDLPNEAPATMKAINDLYVVPGYRTTYQLDTDIFYDNESGSDLTIRAELSDGSSLPSWLTFDQNTLSFEADIWSFHEYLENYEIKVLAFDERGDSAATSFTLNIVEVDEYNNGTDSSESLQGTRSADKILGRGGDDIIYSDSKNDVVYGGDGNDNIYGGTGNDILFGDAGNDVIDGEGNDDTIFGGKGNDHLSGGKGNDTFVYHLGDGNDTIDAYYNEKNAVDRLQFGKNISTDNVSYVQNGQDIIITILSTSETITVSDWFKGSTYELGEIHFADGTVYTPTDVSGMLSSTASYLEASSYTIHEYEDSSDTYKQGPYWRLPSESDMADFIGNRSMPISTQDWFTLDVKPVSDSIKADPREIIMVPNKNPEGMFVDESASQLGTKVLHQVLVPNKNPEGMFEDSDSSGKLGLLTDIQMVPNKSPEGMFLDDIYEKLFDESELSSLRGIAVNTFESDHRVGEIFDKQHKLLQLMIQEASLTINDNENSELSVNSPREENYHSNITIPL